MHVTCSVFIDGKVNLLILLESNHIDNKICLKYILMWHFTDLLQWRVYVRGPGGILFLGQTEAQKTKKNFFRGPPPPPPHPLFQCLDPLCDHIKQQN